MSQNASEKQMDIGEKLSVLILTHNEERNVEKCIESILPLTRSIFVVDSDSTDRTRDICEKYGVTVAARKWTTYADQFNWGLDHFNFSTSWIMRMDADEELTPGLVNAVKEFLGAPEPGVTGLVIRRRVYFMGRWIRHGGYYPTWLLRVFRSGIGRCEALWMDEHIVLSEGKILEIHQDIVDKNNKDLTFWTDKHNRYASREVLDILSKQRDMDGDRIASRLSSNQAENKRWMKTNVYGNAPLFLRAFLYFIYRYFIRLGFLDGKEGLIFHFLQGFWYRFLVDAKLYETEIRNDYSHRIKNSGDREVMSEDGSGAGK